jgi:hypothetical protein
VSNRHASKPLSSLSSLELSDTHVHEP